MLTIQELVTENINRVPLTWITGEQLTQRVVAARGTFSAELVGHLNLIHPARIQVIGSEELAYYGRFGPHRRQHHLEELASGGVPAIIVADGIAAPTDLVTACRALEIPLLATSLAAAHVIDLLRIYLGKRLAPKTIMHGVFMDVLGLGVLITGASGLGKSELALELISRGHGLVADDAVEFARIAPSIIEGQCPPLLQNLLEVRGIGLLDIRTIFGETSVRRKKKLKLIVHLLGASSKPFARLPIQDQTQEVLGLPIKRVKLQVAAGRNLAVLVEAAVRNTILILRGIDTMEEFMERQSIAIMENTKPE